MRYIQGVNRHQKTLFPDIIDDYIAPENPVRIIDAYVDDLDLKCLGIQEYGTKVGRPPYNPKDMLKLCIYSYIEKISSIHKIEVELKRNIELMWLLNKLAPDRKTIARFYKENASIIKHVLENFEKLRIKLDIYNKGLIIIENSRLKEINDIEYDSHNKMLTEKLRRINENISQYLLEIGRNDVLKREP